MKFQTGIGQDSHRFENQDSSKPCIIAGLHIKDCPGFSANSDGDVVYHAICNAISSITHVLVLGGIADELCQKDGITDSEAYLKEAKKTLCDKKISHLAITIEAKKPHLKAHFLEMRQNIARVLEVDVDQVGITATTGEGLSDYGCGDGVQAFCILTTYSD